MSRLSSQGAAFAGALMLVLALAISGSEAAAQAFMRKTTLDDLVKESDSIVQGTCTKKEVIFRDGRIISRYQIKPSQFLKGGVKLSSAGEFTLEQLGGSLEKPLPITQLHPASAQLNAGQEVILFTAEPENVGGPKLADASPAPTQGPRLVGGDHGVFSVVRNPETGDKLVVQGSTAGRLNNLDVAKVAKAEEARRRKVGAAKGSQAGGAGPSLAGAAKAEPAENKPQIKPIERLEAFTADVNNLLKQGKAGTGGA